MITSRFGKVLLAAGMFAASLSASAQTGPFQFHAISPCRIADTRSGFGGILAAATTRDFTVQGVCGIPSGAAAVVVNVTVVGPTQTGFLTLYPSNLASPPLVATLTFNAGEPALGNGAIVPLKATTPDLRAVYGIGGGTATTHVVIDATGYFQ